MSFSYISQNGSIRTSKNCVNDSNIGYAADFSENGNVDKWAFFDGIHTYGCWNNFLFGTLYGDFGLIGRSEVFRAVEAEDFFNLKIVMKISLKERAVGQAVPNTCRIMWKTVSSPVWSSEKSYDFEIHTDNKWHTYIVNMGELQWWQGDVNDLRIYPILEHGRDGDEFFIRAIEILSPSVFKCRNVSCDYFNNYERNCPGIGRRASCSSLSPGRLVMSGSEFDFAEDRIYNITEDTNILYVNINGYGYEKLVFEPQQNLSGRQLANIIANELSKVDIGGYAEAEVEYTDLAEFIIYSGTFTSDSSVSVSDSPMARYLRFFNVFGEDVSIKQTGQNPASGFEPLSAFKIKTHQIYSLIDAEQDTDFYFNPFEYNVEGGRADWLEVGVGQPSKAIVGTESEQSGQMSRSYRKIANDNKTIIDFNHPFNASGRINKIYAAVTLDNIADSSYNSRGGSDSVRQAVQLSGAKIMFFRPQKDGNLRVLPFEIDIPNRDYNSGKIYASVQEHVEINCDLFVNKGDLMGVYNANIYKGVSITGDEIDALYYQLDGKASGVINTNYSPRGQGHAGLLIYARSNQRQKRLYLDVDLGNRVNVSSVKFDMESENEVLDFNVARCLDIDWEIDLFGHDHTTGFIERYRPLVKRYYNHPNLFYGKNCLTDGIYVVPDGKAGDSFSVQRSTYYYSHEAAFGKKDGGYGVQVVNPTYFHVNGDEEWLGVYLHNGLLENGPFAVQDFSSDPIAFTLKFPFEKEKKIYKSKIYFKEKYNFRSFALSLYRGMHYTGGNADDVRFDLIPKRTDGTDTPWSRIILDGLVYYPEDDYGWGDINLYLAKNPSIGHMIKHITGVSIVEYDEDMAYWDELGGLIYQGSFKIDNLQQYLQAVRTDWHTITHEWPTTTAKGFRFYCNSHESTKICEFELYCLVENVGSTLAGSIDVSHSAYQDFWWHGQNSEEGTIVSSFIGDTPRYLTIDITPISETRLKDILIDISLEDVYVGSKGCSTQLLLDSAGRGKDNSSEVVEFKNVYGNPYDLYVDIAHSENEGRKGLVYFSTLKDDESISNPEVGPDSYYVKHPTFKLLNYNSNVAINCPVYALKNLIDGAPAWYTYDDERNWISWGNLTGNTSVEFSNLPDGTITTLNLPVLTRSKWWKVVFLDPRLSSNIREVRVFFDGEEINGVKLYHRKNGNIAYEANVDDAPNLQNTIIDGSYYILQGEDYIGIELPSVQKIDKIVFYHDRINKIGIEANINGIDIATGLCIQPDGDLYRTDSIIDYSYYEHPIQIEGTGIYCDTESTFVDYSFTEDFSTCQPTIREFTGNDGDTPDPVFWADVVSAVIESNMLKVTNSGIVGSVTTADTFYGDFDVFVNYELDSPPAEGGWGAYLVAASTDDVKYVRVGRQYRIQNSAHVISAEGQTTSGFQTLNTQYKDINTGSFRIKRSGTSTALYYYDVSWVTMITTSILGSDPVKFKLIQNLSPLATVVTPVYYDNFNVDNSAYDWGYNNDHTSTFNCVDYTSVSGIEHWVQEFDIGVADYSDAGSYKRPVMFNQNNVPLDNNFEFTFDFKFKLSDFTYNGAAYNTGGVSVGLIHNHVRNNSQFYDWQDFFVGAQMVFRRNSFGIAITSQYAETTTSSWQSGLVLNTIYYCRFTGDGNGTYAAKAWTDNWDGSNQVCNLAHTSSLTWWASKVGYGSGYFELNNESYLTRATGWVSSFDFSCSKILPNFVNKTNSIKFSGIPSEKLLIDYHNGPLCNIDEDKFWIGSKSFCFDFFIKFDRSPEVIDNEIIIAKCWDDRQSIQTGTLIYPCSWALTVIHDGTTVKWRFYMVSNGVSTRLMDIGWVPDCHRWYHIYFARGLGETYRVAFLRDGHVLTNITNNPATVIDKSENDIVVGENLKGWIEQFRFSSDYDMRASRFTSTSNVYNNVLKVPPSGPYERRYTFSIYNSSDNYFYGKNMDVDALFDNSHSYHLPDSFFSDSYYTYFAIDFGQRHDLEIVRSFPIDTAFQFSSTSNVIYSNKDTSDPKLAFELTEFEQNPSTDFSGLPYSYPNGVFYKDDSEAGTSYVLDDFFQQKVSTVGSAQRSRAISKFYFVGDFSFTIDYQTPAAVNTSSWSLGIRIEDANRSNYAFTFLRAFRNNTHSYILERQRGTATTTPVTVVLGDTRGTFKIQRTANLFKFYIKRPDREDFDYLGYSEADSAFLTETIMYLGVYSEGTNYPSVECYWSNFVIELGNFIWSTVNDTRWLKIKMLNGDGTTRTLKRIGVYPDLSTQSTIHGDYNTYWEPLGTSITSFSIEENIALGATVSGSSFVGNMQLSNLTDGFIRNQIEESWGGESELPQWFTINLPNTESIYRVKIYHGYDDKDTFNMVKDYKVQISVDNETFTTIFDITNNSSFERIHDLSSPVEAKYIRIYITNYTAREQYVYTGANTANGYDFWYGPSMRAVEVYKYYDFSIINSENTPVIAIDLQQQYFIYDHYIFGPDAENPDINWDNSNSNFSWSMSNLSDPKKVSFGEWGTDPSYERWLAIKRNTATHYPNLPTTQAPETDKPDYLKYVYVRAAVNEAMKKVNPCEIPWMWRANVSELSSDYDNITYATIRSLRIDYPASSEAEHVRFVEGDTWGVDGRCSWRDGLGFDIYIDDVNNLDLDYGYFYFGGWDTTASKNPVIYKWNLTTLSGILQSGWNQISLTFRYADEIEYTPPAEDQRDPRRLYVMVLGKMGMTFRGKGNPLVINLDGFYIERNRFQHSLGFDYGLYLHDHDVLKIPIGEFDLHAGTIEFFIRPDWDWAGYDTFRDYKFRALFHISNVANDVLGACVTRTGLEVYYGNIVSNFRSFVIPNTEIEIDKIYHFALVFSNDGRAIDVDGSTIRFYVNNQLIGKTNKTWGVSDDKHYSFTFGGQGLLLQKISEPDPRSSSVDAVVGRLKIHNYCKTDFLDSMNLDPEGDRRSLYKPSDLIEISRDNLTFYKVGDPELPFIFEKVPAGDTVQVYVKADLPRRLSGKESRTSGIIGSWDIGV